MKVVCINTGMVTHTLCTHLTLGKVYDSTSFSMSRLCVINNDIGQNVEHHKIRFITLEEYRNRTLGSLLK